MAYDELLGKRIGHLLTASKIKFIEKKMFGGLTFMVKDKMCVGIVKDELMVRCLPDKHGAYIKLPHARIMDFNGKPMKGFLYVGTKGFETEAALQQWIKVGLEFIETAPPKITKPKKK